MSKQKWFPKNFSKSKNAKPINLYTSPENTCSTQITFMYVRQRNVERTKLASVAAEISDNGGSKYNG